MIHRAIEHRVGVETRNDGTKYLRGYAAVYYNPDDSGTEFRLSKRIVERFLPGSLDHVPNNPDLVATFNHNVDQPLGRVPETLRVSTDDVGLFYEIDLPPTQRGEELASDVARRVVRGSSITMAEIDDRLMRDGDDIIRNIERADVVELGPVLNPAYKATSAEMRSLDASIEALERRAKVADSIAKLDKSA